MFGWLVVFLSQADTMELKTLNLPDYVSFVLCCSLGFNYCISASFTDRENQSILITYVHSLLGSPLGCPVPGDLQPDHTLSASVFGLTAENLVQGRL